MHTILVIAVGFLVLAACLVVGRLTGGPDAMRTATLVFLPLWLVGTGVNMTIGVRKAGYTVAEEMPVALVVFAVPALLAALIWWRLR